MLAFPSREAVLAEVMADGSVRFFIRADLRARAPGQVYKHEVFHDVAANNPRIWTQMADYLYDHFTEQQIMRIVGAYVEAYKGIYGMEEGAERKYLEEAFADVYAGIRRVNTDMGIIGETMDAFGEQLDNARRTAEVSEATRETRGSPEQRFSAKGKNNTKPSATTPLSGSLSQKTGSFGTDNQVTAAAELLGIGDNIAQASESVKNAISVLGEFYQAVQDGRSAFGSKNPITADNLTGMLVKKGVLQRQGTESAYRIDSGRTLRISNHYANTANFKTSVALSVVLKGGKISGSFFSSPNKNVVEVVFSKKYLNEHPEELQKLISDLGNFIVTGRYNDSVKARQYNTSGNPQRVMYSMAEEADTDNGIGVSNPGLGRVGESADETYLAAVERGDMEAAQKMVDEAARKAGYTIHAYHGTTAEFNVFEGGAFFTDDYFNADGYASGERVIDAYLRLDNPLVIDANGENGMNWTLRTAAAQGKSQRILVTNMTASFSKALPIAGWMTLTQERALSITSEILLR